MNAIPEGIIAAASGGSPQGQASTSGALGAPQNGGGNLPDSGTGTDTAADGSVDDNWDNYGEPMSSWSFGSIGENHTELRGVCDVTCWGSARALARSAAIMMGWSPQQAHRALEIVDYATMFIPSRVITRGAVKTSVIGPIQIGVANTPRKLAEPFYKTTKEATEAAKELGFSKIKETVHNGHTVYKKGNRYITRDLDGHNGGAWKMAKSIRALEARETRSGTYDKDLNWMGD